MIWFLQVMILKRSITTNKFWTLISASKTSDTFLDFIIARSSQGISLSQLKYTLDILQQTGLLAAKPASTPMDPTFQLNNDTNKVLSNPTTFRSLVDKLLYLFHSRPGICFVVCRLSHHLACPSESHLQTTLRIPNGSFSVRVWVMYGLECSRFFGFWELKSLNAMNPWYLHE